jgi:Sec-independent protein translocase protein TatA
MVSEFGFIEWVLIAVVLVILFKSFINNDRRP